MDELAGELAVDIAIVGAGPVGLALAGWLAGRSGTRALSVAIIDARDAAQAAPGTQADPRALALSHGSRVLLEPLGWPADATPIRHIHISQRGHFGRTLIDHREHDLPALGYVVRYGTLAASLAAHLQGGPALWLRQCTAQLQDQDAQGVRLLLRQTGAPERILRAALVINAEGGVYRAQPAGGAAEQNSRGVSDTACGPATPQTAYAQQAARPAPRHHDYRQTALVASVRVARPRANFAWERFTPEGPLALLPLSRADNHHGLHQDEFALVWCGRDEAVQQRMALAPHDFLLALQAAFGERMGAFTQVSGRAAFALGLQARRELVSGRIAAIGNAAQTLHPVAGQGLNLGLRDAHALAEALAQHGATPLALSAFARNRTLDRHLTIAATDALARVFAVDVAPLAMLRGGALAALDFVPGAKRTLARQMMFGQRR